MELTHALGGGFGDLFENQELNKHDFIETINAANDNDNDVDEQQATKDSN